MDDARAFLRLCLRLPHDERAREAARAVMAGSGLDWDGIAAAADAARVAPLLHRALRDEPLVPAATRARLRRAYLANAYRNVVLLREAAGAVAALEAAGVPSIVLKGGALAHAVYGNVGVRPLMDVDVLMRREHLEPALRVLDGVGFAAPRAETRAGAAAAYESEMLLLKAASFPVALELHWSLFDSPFYQETLDLEECWTAAVPLAFGATTARMLDPVSQLLHLCGHLVLHHGGRDLLWEHDIAEWVRVNGAGFDWERFLRKAEEWNLVIAVRQLLLPLADGGAPIPAAVAARLRQLQPSAGERRAVGYMTAPARGVAQRFWADLASMGGWRARFGYAWTHLFPSAEYMRQRYGIRHPLLMPLYYPYRWLRGLRG